MGICHSNFAASLNITSHIRVPALESWLWFPAKAHPGRHQVMAQGNWGLATYLGGLGWVLSSWLQPPARSHYQHFGKGTSAHAIYVCLFLSLKSVEELRKWRKFKSSGMKIKISPNAKPVLSHQGSQWQMCNWMDYGVWPLHRTGRTDLQLVNTSVAYHCFRPASVLFGQNPRPIQLLNIWVSLLPYQSEICGKQ